MLFFENELKKVSEKLMPAELSAMRLQDPRVNGQLWKDQLVRENETKESRE